MGGISKEDELPKPPAEKDLKVEILKYGSRGPAVKELKKKLNAHGDYGLDVENESFLVKTEACVKDFQAKRGLVTDGIVGPKTWAELDKEPKKEDPKPVVPPGKRASDQWMNIAEDHKGNKETDPEYNKKMSAKWSLFGMDLGTISKSWAAWCGLFAAVVLSGAGLQYAKNGSLARNWAKYGVAIDYRLNGIPRGAILHINGKGDCKSSSGNHVTFANGDCAPEDIVFSGATIDGLGGNQSNMVKVSTYPVSHLCAVRWPEGVGDAPKITKSVNCTSKSKTGESTR